MVNDNSISPLTPRHTIAITGGAGFIGGHLVRRLVVTGVRVNVLDDLSTGSEGNLPDSNLVTLIKGSVLDPSAVKQSTHGTCLVIHMASVVGMRLATEEPRYAFSVSKNGSQCVADNSFNTPLLLFSSSSVYGLGNDSMMMREDISVTRDIALLYDGGVEGYATGKWELERVGIDAMNTGRDVIIIRPFNIVGPGQSSAYGMVLPSFVRRILRGLPVIVHDDGCQTRSFGDVETFIEIVMRLIRTSNAWKSGYNIINVGQPELISIKQLALIVMAEVERNVPLEYVAYNQVFPGKTDVRARLPDDAHLTSLIGNIKWKNIREIVRECIHHELSVQQTSRKPSASNTFDNNEAKVARADQNDLKPSTIVDPEDETVS